MEAIPELDEGSYGQGNVNQDMLAFPQKEEFRAAYVVVDLDKKQKGVLTFVRGSDTDRNGVSVGGLCVQFQSVNGRTLWSENASNIVSLKKIAQSEADLRINMGSEDQSVFFRFLTVEAKLEVMLILSKVNVRATIEDDSIVASLDGSSITYKVNMITKANRHPKTVEIDLITGTITRRGTGNIRDITEIDHNLALEVHPNKRQITYKVVNKVNVPACTLIFASSMHVYDFLSHIIKVRENLPQRPKRPYDMKEFEKLNTFGKNLRSWLLRNRAFNAINQSGAEMFSAKDFLDGMRNLPPLVGFSDSSNEATTRAMSKYGIVQRDEHNGMWHFRKSGCGSTLTIRTVTWNVGENDVEDIEHIDFLLFGKRKSDSQKDNCKIDNRKKHDIYVIGLQECKADDLQSYIASLERVCGSSSPGSTAGGDYTTLTVQSMWKIHLILIVRKSILPHISHLCKAVQKTGALKNMVGNKGGIGIYMELYGTTKVSFVTCHLAARFERKKKRATDFRHIVSGLSSKLVNCSGGLLESCDHSFWMGDLNYRVDFGQYGTEEEYNSVAWLSEACNKIHYDKLLQNDQLRTEMMALKTFVNFREGDIKFPPTYRCEKEHLLKYNNKRNQNPDIVQLEYSGINNVDSSDHKPVYADFELTCRRPYLAPTKFGAVPLIVSKPRIVICDLKFTAATSYLVDDESASERPSKMDGIGDSDAMDEIGDDIIEEDNGSEYFSALKSGSVSSTIRGNASFHHKQSTALQSINFVHTLRKRDHRDSVFNEVEHLTSKDGWLYKKRQGTSLFKPSVWQKRWVELKNYYIIYRRKPDENSPIMASIDLRNVSRCQVAEKGIIFLFCAAFRSGVYPLKAKTEEDAIEWANVINERIVDSDDGTGTGYTNKQLLFSVSEDHSDAEESSIVDSPDTLKKKSMDTVSSPAITNNDKQIETMHDINFSMNGALCVRLEGECIHNSEISSSTMAQEVFSCGHDTNNNFPLNASREFLDGTNIEISKMAMRHERDLSYMAYTVVTYLNNDLSKPASTVTRSFLQFEELHALVLRKLPSLQGRIEPLVNQNQNSKKRTAINNELERYALDYFIKALSKIKEVWALPEFHQFLDDFATFETEKVWSWDNSNMRPLMSTLDDMEWLKKQKLRFYIEDGYGRLRGMNTISPSLCGVLPLEKLNDDGSFTISIYRNNVPHGILSGQVHIDVFDPEIMVSKIQLEYHNDHKRIHQAYVGLCNNLTQTINVRVSGSKLMDLEEKKPYTAYIIEIKFGGKKWEVERRFRLFHDLHKVIVDKMPFLRSKMPKFPDKTFLGIGKLNNNVVKERVSELSVYLKHLAKIEDIWQLSYFINFIDSREMTLLQTLNKIRCYRVAGILSQYEVLPSDANSLGPHRNHNNRGYALSSYGEENFPDMTSSFTKRNTHVSQLRHKFEKAASTNTKDTESSFISEGGIYREEQIGASPATLLHTNTGEMKVLLEEEEGISGQLSSNSNEERTSEKNPVEGYVSTTTTNTRLAQKSIFKDRKTPLHSTSNIIGDTKSTTTEEEARRKVQTKDEFLLSSESGARSKSWISSKLSKVPTTLSKNTIKVIKFSRGCVIMSINGSGTTQLSFCREDQIGGTSVM